MKMILILVASIIIIQTQADKIVQAQVLFRHGARNQIYKNWNWEKYASVMEYLTPVGQRQHYVLGSWLRERYVKTAGSTSPLAFLDPIFNQNEIRVQTTDVNRTIMSALSNLYGMFPIDQDDAPTLPNSPNYNKSLFLPPIENIQPIVLDNDTYPTPHRFQPIPLHMVSAEDDRLLRSYSAPGCPAATSFQQKNKQTDLYKSVVNASKPLFQQYGSQMQLSKDEIDKLNIETLSYQQDTFVVDIWNDYELPPGITNDTLEQMQKLYLTQLNLALYQTWDQARLMATPFLKEVVQNMDNILYGTNKFYKWHTYSAHDTTVLLMLNALNQTSSKCQVQAYLGQNITDPNCIITYPGFASNLIFELYLEEPGNRSYVKALYNGTELDLCPQYSKIKNQCDFEDFKTIINNQALDFDAGCGLNLSSESKAPTWVWVLFALSLVLAVGSFVFACYAYSKWKAATRSSVYLQQD